MPKIAEVLKQEKPDEYEKLLNDIFGFKFCFNSDNTEEGEKAMHNKYGRTDINVLPWALDPIAQVRKDCVIICKRVAEVFGGGIDGKGGTWVRDKILPVFKYCAEQKEFKDKYHQRIVLLQGLAAVGPFVKEETLETHVSLPNASNLRAARARQACAAKSSQKAVEMVHALRWHRAAMAPLTCAPRRGQLKLVIDMAEEKLDNGNYVPSLRLMIARDLALVGPYFKSEKGQKFKSSDLVDCLTKLERDEDPDVRPPPLA